MKLIVFVSTCALAIAASAYAQTDSGDISDRARVRIGTLRFDPTVTLTNFGVDNNVFNQTDADHPQSDFTATITPKTDWSTRLGRSVLSGVLQEDLVYYRRFASERSANTTARVALFVPRNRVTFRTGFTYVDTRDRPGFEIDVRSRHTQGDVDGALDVKVFGKTFVSAIGRRETVDFERGSLFLGADLQEQLSRVVTSEGVEVRHDMTPLTALIVNVAREQDRFDFSSERDSDSTSVLAGVSLQPRALIHGSATVGYRAFEPLAADVPAYHGAIVRADVSSTIASGTRLTLQVQRDVQFSYDIDQPYYLMTGFTAGLIQAVGGPFDVGIRAGATGLQYRGRLGAAAALADRTDHIQALGGMVGYRVGHGAQIALNIDQQSRSSDATGRQYGGLKVGTSVNYGF